MNELPFSSAEINELKEAFGALGSLFFGQKSNIRINKTFETGICNFPPFYLEVYNKSIEIFEKEFPGRKNELYVVKAPMETYRLGENCFSLHSRQNENLQDFWKIFEQIKKFSDNLQIRGYSADSLIIDEMNP